MKESKPFCYFIYIVQIDMIIESRLIPFEGEKELMKQSNIIKYP